LTEKRPKKINRQVDLLKTSITDFIKDRAIPPGCVVGEKISTKNMSQQCIYKIISLRSIVSCYLCGKPLQKDGRSAYNLCRIEEYLFKTHRSFMTYSVKMKKIIRKFKYKKIFGLKEGLAGFLFDTYDKNFARRDTDYTDTVSGEHTGMLAGSFLNRQIVPFKANIYG